MHALWQLTKHQQDSARTLQTTHSRCVLLHPFVTCPSKELAQWHERNRWDRTCQQGRNRGQQHGDHQCKAQLILENVQTCGAVRIHVTLGDLFVNESEPSRPTSRRLVVLLATRHVVGSRGACPVASCQTAAKHFAQIAEQLPTWRTSALILGLCGRVSTCPSKESSRNLDGFGSVRNEEIDSNTLDVVGAELQILEDVQTHGVVRIHKEHTLHCTAGPANPI